MKLLPILAALLLGAPSTAQAARYVIVGSGCSTGRLSPSVGPVPFSVQGLPRLGGRFTVVTEGTTSYPWGVRRLALLMTGTSNANVGGVPLPFDISLLFPGEPVCGLLRTSSEVVLRMPNVNDYRTPVRIPIDVPNVPAMAGVRFFQQVLSMEFSSFGPPFRAMALSAGGEGTIGF